MDSSLLRVTPRALMLLTRLMPVMSDGGSTWMLRVPRERKMISADLDWLRWRLLAVHLHMTVNFRPGQSNTYHLRTWASHCPQRRDTCRSPPLMTKVAGPNADPCITLANMSMISEYSSQSRVQWERCSKKSFIHCCRFRLVREEMIPCEGGYCAWRIGNHTQAFEWYQFEWPSVTFSRSWLFNVK